MADYAIPSVPLPADKTGASADYPSSTVYDLPNFVGELYSLIPAQTPFLSMGGGLTGGKSVASTEHTWQVEDNVAATANNARREGDDPIEGAVIRQQVKNVLEIHQEAVNVSYTKQGATGMVAGVTSLPNAQAANFTQLGSQPVNGEIPHQLGLKINQIARDVELSMLLGVYVNPTDNLTERNMRGILTAATTHVQDNTIDAGSISESLDLLLIGMYENELAVAPLIQPVIFVNGSTKTKLSRDYTNNLGLADRSRTIGGVNVETIVTDFGTFGVVLDRYMPVDELALFDMSVVSPCFLEVPGKGHFFTEPLAKTGAYDRAQIYGEIGLEYGPEQYHGKIVNIA